MDIDNLLRLEFLRSMIRFFHLGFMGLFYYLCFEIDFLFDLGFVKACGGGGWMIVGCNFGGGCGLISGGARLRFWVLWWWRLEGRGPGRVVKWCIKVIF